MTNKFHDYQKYKYLSEIEGRSFPCGCWAEETSPHCENKSSIHYFNNDDPTHTYGVIVCSLKCFEKYATPVLDPDYKEPDNDDES